MLEVSKLIAFLAEDFDFELDMRLAHLKTE